MPGSFVGEGALQTHLPYAGNVRQYTRKTDFTSLYINVDCVRYSIGIVTSFHRSCTGIENNMLCDILAMTEFTKGEMPVRYLGIPLAAQRLSVRDYSPLVDQIANSISRWAAKSLSFAGRLELIRSVIQGVEYFWLQIFPPAVVVEKIHDLCGIFSGTRNEHRHALDTVGRRCLSQRRISLGLATEEGRLTIFNGLPKSATESLPPLARPRRQSSTWLNGATVKDLIRPKYMSTSGRNEQKQLGRR
ncbi:hypothetical protein Sango_3013000 [Sesamum angolense]|uniref:Reverse transcriptase n=1 Tax=Sesamum angolense TaxID=2727404 RepID=A0AAE1T4C0_9LAMI|nr:hypothetical protein Sango_3013000 [Sesamum angolense]